MSYSSVIPFGRLRRSSSPSEIGSVLVSSKILSSCTCALRFSCHWPSEKVLTSTLSEKPKSKSTITSGVRRKQLSHRERQARSRSPDPALDAGAAPFRFDLAGSRPVDPRELAFED